jgi:AraC-like DNA-binding protein
MIATTLASGSRPLWRLLERHKIDPAHVFREAGLDPRLMDEPRGRYTAEQQRAAWRKAAELIDNPCFGLKIAEVWSPTDLHALGYAFLASSTLRTALERFSRYVHILVDGVGYELGDEGDNVTFCVRSDSDLYRRRLPPHEDSGWAVITSLCRVAYGEALSPAEVRFRHSAPTCAGDFYAFFRCPVTFDAEVSAILFARADVDRPLPASNKELARANDRILSDFLNTLRRDDLVTRVKTAITEGLTSGTPTDDQIAQALFMSARTLSRRLSALGTNYSQILEAVRRELAEQYVADPSLTLSEIAFLLGFSEQSAFSRAFRRWTGQSPSAARGTAAA